MGYWINVYPLGGGAYCAPSISGLEGKIMRSDNNVLLWSFVKQDWVAFMSQPYRVKVKVVVELRLILRLKLLMRLKLI